MAKHLPKKTVEKNVYDLALERIGHAFDLFDHIAVLFSGGKDSTAVLHVALDEAKKRGRFPLDVIFYDEECIAYETEEYMREVAGWPEISLRWYCLPVQHRNGCSRRSPYWWPWAPEARDLWTRPMPPEGITEVDGFTVEPPEKRYTIPQTAGLLFPPERYGNVGMVMGIRAQESITRLRAVTNRTVDNYVIRYSDLTSANNVWKVYPIYDWRHQDVWTAPKRFGWPYNRAYDAMDKAGIPIGGQRLAPPYGEEPMGLLWMWAKCFPDLWEKMCRRVPGATTGAMYSRTELYSHGKRTRKPDWIGWEEYIFGLVEKFNEKNQRKVAAYIRGKIRTHYNKTRDPILEVTHPETGLSWPFLQAIATRGDFKHRKQELVLISGNKPKEILERDYQEALSRHREAHG